MSTVMERKSTGAARLPYKVADLSLADDERAQVSDLLYRLYQRMLLSPAPVIAAVDGPAVGGGAQLALASDLRVGGAGARLRFVGPGHGLAVGSWGLPSLVGRGRGCEQGGHR